MEALTRRAKPVITLVYYIVFIVIIILLIRTLYHNQKEAERQVKLQQPDVGSGRGNERLVSPEVEKVSATKRDRPEETSTPDMEPYREYDLSQAPTSFNFNHNDDEDSDDNDLITFDDFKKICQTPAFIKNFTKSLKISFDEKLKRYHPFKKKVEERLEGMKARNGRQQPQSIEFGRALGLNNDLEIIIDTLKRRLKELSETEVKRSFRKIIYNKRQGFQAIIGQEHIKNDIARTLYVFSNNAKLFLSGFQNMIILGNPGLGKTKLAECMAYIYSKTGILCRKRFELIKGTDLISPFVSDTPGHASAILERNLESYLGIDEAQDMGSDDPHRSNHGGEAINAFLGFMDTYHGLQIVSFHGYKQQFYDNVLSKNPGLKRRFKVTYELVDYTPTELTLILIRFLEEKGSISVSQKEAEALAAMINHTLSQLPRAFDDQAGDMTNMTDEILTISSASRTRHYQKGNETNNIKLFKSGLESYLKRKLKGEVQRLY